ncbi:MAG: hypothetical protein KC457_23140 [Myxococcales bacterium]|nr:hypothetical protein [Myxococcales bacterium]
MVSLLGYTPDVFMGPLMGVLTERYPGVGHQALFYVVAAFAGLGLLATLGFRRVSEQPARSTM